MSTQKPISLILASASPRRRELLTNMGCVFTVQSADVDESQQPKESPEDYVTRLAQDKASAVLQRVLGENGQVSSDFAVLAADTIVSHEGAVFGKPADKVEAIRIWRQLANTQHHVMTAVCLAVHGKVEFRLVRTMVDFGSINDEQMSRYWASGEPQDKAGGYAIQGLASAWVKLIHGSYTNVVGLPLRETNQLLELVGHNWL